MGTETTRIIKCEAVECAYNMNNKCRAIAITIGDRGCPVCYTVMKSFEKGGFPDTIGKVGACKAIACQLNNALECTADGIQIKMHSGHAECGTFRARYAIAR